MAQVSRKLVQRRHNKTLERIKDLERQLATASTSATPCVPPSQGNVKLPPFEPSSEFADPEGWCAIVDLWVAKYEPDQMELIMALSRALKGEAANWMVSAKPVEKDWTSLKAEFLAVFAKPLDPLEQFSEAVNGKKKTSEHTTLIDEMLHSMRTILALLKNRDSDEAFAVLVACYFGSTRESFVRRRFQAERPKDAKTMCSMLQGRLGKRSALSPSRPHTEAKRRAPSPKREKGSHFSGRCHNCGRNGHRAIHCRRRRMPSTSHQDSRRENRSVSCYTCGKPDHISPNCPSASRKPRADIPEKRVSLCEKQPMPAGQLKLISGEVFPFLFDTGSDCSLVKESCASHFNGKRYNNLTSLRGIGSNSFL